MKIIPAVVGALLFAGTSSAWIISFDWCRAGRCGQKAVVSTNPPGDAGKCFKLPEKPKTVNGVKTSGAPTYIQWNPGTDLGYVLTVFESKKCVQGDVPKKGQKPKNRWTLVAPGLNNRMVVSNTFPVRAFKVTKAKGKSGNKDKMKTVTT
jgi:hypothetical protein